MRRPRAPGNQDAQGAGGLQPRTPEALEPAFSALSDTVNALKKKNNRNRKLLETRLATIRFMNERLGLTRNIYAKGVLL